MTDIQKEIYNSYLCALAKANNRPYKPRKNFSTLDDDTLNYLYRLEVFFTQFKHINPFNFFNASFEYRKISYIPLSDFIKHSAVVAYSRNSKEKYNDFIDSDKSIENFINGYKNIVAFCLSNNLPVEQYRTCVNNMGIPWVLIHLNEQKISFYHLHALDISRTELNSDYIDITFHEFDNVFNETKQKYINSNKLKQIANKLNQKISNKQIEINKL
jgi:hypothetical protein